jgi:hypothetical protein
VLVLLALGMVLPGAAAEQCQWGGVDLEGRPIPADSWLCTDRVVHGVPSTPVPTATNTPTPLPTATPTITSTPTVTPTATPTPVVRREACREAVELVQAFPTSRGVPLRDAVVDSLAAARASGARIEVDGWSASGPPPPCQVQLNYRDAGQTVRLRWELDPDTGEVRPLDPRTAQASGLESGTAGAR